MRPCEPLPAPAPRPLLPDERAWLRQCIEAGDPVELVSAYAGRSIDEVRQVVERREERP